MHHLRILERNMIAKDTIEVVFDRHGEMCDFRPGQYLSITLPELLYPDPKGAHRDFSIASSPNNKETLTVAFRVSKSGFKQTLINMPLGAKVDAECCYGTFTLPEESERPVGFVAGGIGITPFLSIIRYAAEEKLPHKIFLLYGNRDAESAAYLEELEALEKENPNFKLEKIFGPLTEETLRKSVGAMENAHWSVAGSPSMVSLVKKAFAHSGVPSENIRSEEFAGYAERAEDGDSRKPEHSAVEDSVASIGESMLNALNTLAIVSETDPQGAMTYVNDKFLEISKYERKELIGQNHRILKSGFMPPAIYEDLWKTISSGKVWRGEIKNKAKDGSFYWVDASIAPIFGTDGAIAKYLAVRFPITDKKENEDRANLLAGIVEQTSQAWGIADISGKMMNANKAFLIMFGYTLAETRELGYADIIASEERERISNSIAAAAQSTDSFSTETTCIRKDGSTVPVLLLVDFYRENGMPKYVYAFLSDITEQRKREREMAERLADIEKLNQLMVGRELKMIELKEKLAAIEKTSTP